jgi:hypothetical protein
LKLPVTCVGRFVRVRAIGELKLPMEVAVTLMFPHCPWVTTTGLGLTAIPKSEGAVVTVNVTVILCEIRGRLEDPVIVRLYVPLGVLSDVGIVNVEDTVPPAGGVTDEGTILACAPGGRPPVTWRLTAELKPSIEAIEKVYVAV